MLRIDRQALIVVGNGFAVLALFSPDAAAIVVGVGKLGIDRQCLVVIRDGLVEFTLLSIGVAAIVFYSDDVGRVAGIEEPQGLIVGVNGFVVLALFAPGIATLEVILRIIVRLKWKEWQGNSVRPQPNSGKDAA